MHSRRKFLTGAGGGVLATAWPCGAVAMLTDAALLAEPQLPERKLLTGVGD